MKRSGFKVLARRAGWSGIKCVPLGTIPRVYRPVQLGAGGLWRAKALARGKEERRRVEGEDRELEQSGLCRVLFAL